MAQVWTVIGFMATAMAATVTFAIRAMTLHGKVVGTQIEGLRNEMMARFDSVEGRLKKVETIDREVHALTLKVFGREPPEK